MTKLSKGLASVLIAASFLLSIPAQTPGPVYFEKFIAKRVGAGDPAWDPERFCPVSSSMVARRVLQDYGALFATTETVTLPSTCIHSGESDVLKFQRTIEVKTLEMNGATIRLQKAAAGALELAVADATVAGLSITPLDGTIAGGRSYGDTLLLWNSRFFPALDYWIKRERLSEADREGLSRLDLQKRVEKVLEWESVGIFFSTNRTRSIMTSVAPPGTSQHLALLAFDVNEYWDSEVRQILNRRGWYQTVVDDAPHFTYLGVPEIEIPSRGLMAVRKGSFMYWIPNLQPKTVSAGR